MVGYVAVPFQLYALTGSNFAVGAYGLVQLVPLVLAGLYGGALADRLDRRRVLVLTGVAQVAGTAVLLVNALAPHPSVPVVYGVGVVMAVAQSLQSPSREALVPRTVRHAELPAAVALSSVGRAGRDARRTRARRGAAGDGGPAVGLRRHAGRLRGRDRAVRAAAPLPAAGGPVRPPGRCGRSATAWSTRCAVPTCWAPTSSTWSRCSWRCRWCCSPRWPPRCSTRPALLGLLYSAGTVGSLLATATSGWTARRAPPRARGGAVGGGVGASVVLAGLTTVPALVLLGLVLAGAFDMISGLFRATIWHQTIPDSHRGRLAGIEMLSYTLGPLGGEARAGPGGGRDVGPDGDRQRRRAVRRRGGAATAAALRASGTTTPGRTSTRCGSGAAGGGRPMAERCSSRRSRCRSGTGPSSGGGSARAVCSGSSGESASSASVVPGGAASTARTGARRGDRVEPGPVAVDHQRDDTAAVRPAERRRLGRRDRAPAGPSAGSRPRPPPARRGPARCPAPPPRARPAPARRTAARSAPAAAARGRPRSAAWSRRRRRARPAAPPRRSAAPAPARGPRPRGSVGGQPREVGGDVLARLRPEPDRAGRRRAADGRDRDPAYQASERAATTSTQRRAATACPPIGCVTGAHSAAGPAPGRDPRGTGW